MGLDGLSIANLGLNRDKTSKENAINADSLAQSRGVWDASIDQLNKKEAITSEDHDNPSFSGGFTEDEETDENEIKDTYETDEEVDYVENREHKDYKFSIIDDSVYVNDAESGDYIAEFPLSELLKVTSLAKQPGGIIINRKV